MNSEFNIIINTRLDTSGDSIRGMMAQVAFLQDIMDSEGGLTLKTKLSDDVEGDLQQQLGRMRQSLQDESLLVKASMDTDALMDVDSVFKSFKDNYLNTDLSLKVKINPEDKNILAEEMESIKGIIGKLETEPVEINLGLREGVAEGIRENVRRLEEDLKELDISIGIGIDEEAEKKVNEQLKEMQAQISNLKENKAYADMKKEVEAAQQASQRMSDDLDKARRSAELLSEKLITSEAGDLLGSEQLRRTGLTETERSITQYSASGDASTILETENDYIKAQKELYEAIKKLRREMVQIDNQAVKATEEESAALMVARDERMALAEEARKNLEIHGLVSDEMDEELRLTEELNRIQLEIRENKDLDVQSRSAYKELEREIKEEHRLQKRIVRETAEVQEVSAQQIAESQERQQKIQERISTDGLKNAERELEVQELLRKSFADQEHEKAKSAQREEIRIAKLNERVTGMDYREHNFYDHESMQDFVLSMHSANSEITKFTPHIDAAGNRQLQLTVATNTASNKLREYKYVIDESSEALYKLGESTRPNTARMVGFLGQMREAITKSITWGLSMELLYGNIRRLREGVEFIKELDQELTQVKIITGMTDAETKELARSYAELGQEMGKTAGEISKVNTELIRQGLSAEVSAERMQTVMKLSATSGMSTEQALQVATSSVNALGIEAEHSADVLLKAGQISASSAEQIGEALTKMASSAKASGMSIEETTALISTLVEVTQESPSSLGNSLKTLMARFSQINEETGETNEELNKVQEAFESVGVSFVDSEGQIRPFYDLLTDLSGVWDTLDKNTQSYLATSAAGIRQQNRFIGIMDNFNRVQETHLDLLGASGTMEESYGQYLDSVEASANRAQAAMESLWIETISSDSIKYFYDAVTWVTQLIEKIGLLRVAMTALIALFMSGNSVFSEFTSSLAINIVDSLSGKVDAMTATLMQNQAQAILSGRAIDLMGLSFTGAGIKSGILSGALKILQFEVLGLKIGVMALQAVVTLGLSAAITAVVTVISRLVTSKKRLKRETDELTESVERNMKQHNNNVQSLSRVADEYDNLNKKLGENRDFTKLTEEEQSRYNAIVSEMTNIAPEVIQGYDDKGNAIVDYTLKIEDLIDKEKELADLERFRLLGDKDNIISQANKEIANQEKEIRKLDEQIQTKQSNIDRFEGSIDLSVGDTEHNRQYSDSIKENRAELARLNAERAVATNNIEEEMTEMDKLLDIYLMEMDEIDGLSDSLKRLAKERVSTILRDTNDFDEAQSQVYLLTEAFQELVDLIGDSGDNLSQGEVKEAIRLLEEMGLESDFAAEVMLEFAGSTEEANTFLGHLSDTLDRSKDSAREASKSIGKLDDTIQKLASGEPLTNEQLFDLIDSNEDILNYIAETGDLTLKQGKLMEEIRYKERMDALQKLQLSQEQARLDLEQAQQARKRAEEDLAFFEKSTNIESKLIDDKRKKLEDTLRVEKELTKTVDDRARRARAEEAILSQGFTGVDAEEATTSFTDATKNIDYYNKLIDKINEHGKLSAEMNREIIESHADLIPFLNDEANMRIYLMDLIEEEKQVQADAYREKLFSTEAFSKNLFNSHRDLFESVFKLYDLDLENFTTITRAKAQLMQQMTNSMSRMSQRHLDSVQGDANKARENVRMLQEEYDRVIGSDGKATGAERGMHLIGIRTEDLGKELSNAKRAAELFSTLDTVDTGFSDINITPPRTSGATRSAGSSASSVQRDREQVELAIDRYQKYEVALEEVNLAITKNNELLELSSGEDRIKFLNKEIELLSEKQQVISRTTSELRKERTELRAALKSTIDLEDGSMGIDSFNAYAKETEANINSMINTLNSTKGDSARQKLENDIERTEKAYNKLEEQFNRLIEINLEIPANQAEWWANEYEKFNKSMEALDVNFEKYEKRIDNINTLLSLKVSYGDESIEVLEEEYELLQDINDLYTDSLDDISDRMTSVTQGIATYEGRIQELGNVRDSTYDSAIRRLAMLRAEEDRLFEIQKANITALSASYQNSVDKYMEKLEIAKNKTLDAFDEMRRSADGFTLDKFDQSMDEIIFKLNVIDGIFRENADFNLSTSEARSDISSWVSDINSAYSDVQGLQARLNNLIAIEANTEEEIAEKRERIAELIEEQIGHELDLQDIGSEIENQMANMAADHREVEAALAERIRLRQKELDELREQYRQEDRIRDMLQKQLELMRVYDDTRYSYITGQGDEIFTYDQSRVDELQKEIAEMTREQEREDAIDAATEDIARLQEDLQTTREINAEQLNILRVANEGIQGLLGMVDSEISRGEGEIESLYESAGKVFADSLMDELRPLIEDFKEWARRILDRVVISTPAESRGITDEALRRSLPAYDTGGMTRNVPRQGAPAILHDKELVLNEQDTRNILESVDLTREFAGILSRFSAPQQINRETNQEDRSMTINNPVFNGVENIGDFANKLNDLYRRGMPQMG